MSKRAQEERTFGLGTVRAVGKESSYGLRCDRMAVSEYGLMYLVSVAGDAGAVRGFGAALNNGSAPSLDYDDLEFYRGEDRKSFKYSTGLKRVDGGYKRFSARLAYGKLHALFVSRSPSFLPCVSEEAVWQALTGPAFTTPLLRHWMPHLTATLIGHERLKYAYGHNCRCGVLTATTEQLDAVVSEGVRAGFLPLRADEAPRRGRQRQGGRRRLAATA